jgi:hypothetical protein
MMRAPLWLLLWPLAVSAAPHLDLQVDLDPASRAFTATASLSDDQGLSGFSLAPGFEITALTVDGGPVAARTDTRHGRTLYRLPPGSRAVRIAYQASLHPLARLDHRQVLQALPAMADPDGSFLASGAGWYPDPGMPFSYRVRLGLPKGQKGLVPGDLVQEDDTARGYRAEFDFAHPAEGIDLMAGPYALSERSLALPDGQAIRVRTWFHPELAGLAPGYLEDSARYLSRYSQSIGDYPFGLFSVVSSPLPTGFGMPSLTYLGRDVIKLPFIRATSLGHEVLHNWWGNGVYPDWQHGNWSEGLTTFLADYAYQEDQGTEAAREMRLGWLRDLAAVPASEDIALKDFVARHHGISSIVGYNKSAMVFSMLRDLIGPAAFEAGLRLLWQRKRFSTAGWSDLEAAFSEAAGRPLAGFFQQWVAQPGSPSLRLQGAAQQGDRLQLTLAQAGDAAVRVALRLVYDDRAEDRWVELAGRKASVMIKVRGTVRSVQLDPDYRLWRRVDPALMPAILREVFVAPEAGLVVADGAPGLREAAQALAGRILDTEPAILPARTSPGPGPLLVMGSPPAVDAWLSRQGLPPRPAELTPSSTAQVWAGRDATGRPYAVVSAWDAAALKALERGLPHYGKQSWLVFDGPRASAKGIWPPGTEEIRLPP